MMNWRTRLSTLAILITLATQSAHAQSTLLYAYIGDNVGPGTLVLHSERWNGELIEKQYVVDVSDQPDLLALMRRYPEDLWLVHIEDDLVVSAHRTRSASVLKSETSALAHPSPQTRQSRSLSTGFEDEVVYLTNVIRAGIGVAPLKNVANLFQSADNHSKKMADHDFFAHCDLTNGKDPFTRMRDAGYFLNAGSENIAAGHADPYEVLHGTYGWMNSSGHRANIESPMFREIGAGYAYSNDGQSDARDQNGDCQADGSGGPYGHYWTQNFGRRESVYPIVIELELPLIDRREVNMFVYGPSNASSMRFRNENGNWSAWESYVPTKNWSLSNGNGTKTVYVQVSTGNNGAGTVYASQDEIEMIGASSCQPLVLINQVLQGSQTLSGCEIRVEGNVTVTGNIILEGGEVLIEQLEVEKGATFEIR